MIQPFTPPIRREKALTSPGDIETIKNALMLKL